MASPASIKSLLASMTLEEKIGQLTMAAPASGQALHPDELREAIRGGGTGSLINLMGRELITSLQRAAIEDSRLGIPLIFAHDILHGYRTLMPIPLGEAATFDPAIWEKTAALAAAEASQAGIALTFAPMIDVARDPRWGRMSEGPGEDPWLASRFATAKVRGFQGCAEAYAASEGRIAATAKHFVAYGAVRAGLEYAEVDLSERLLQEAYLPPFRAAVEAGVAAIMPAFVDLGGTPMTAHRALLRDLLRGDWGFEGVLISDYGAIGELITHGVARDAIKAAALAMQASIDIDMASGIYGRGLPQALARGLVSMDEIDAAVLRVLRLKERLGLFDDPYRAAPSPQGLSRLKEASNVAREAAARSFVLLRNEDALPLRDKGERLLLVTPFEDWAATMGGPWFADGRPEEVATLLSTLRTALPGSHVDELVLPDSCDTPAVLQLASISAAKADRIILWLGETRDMSGEATSRMAPIIPKAQQRLFFELQSLGKPVIVLLATGRPLVSPDVIDAAQAVLVTWFAGTQAGSAVAQVLTGQRDATGRLPVSWPAQIGQIPIHYARPPSGRPANEADKLTSRYLDGSSEPQFPFGYGLSYARFSISPPLLAQAEIPVGAKVEIRARVSNVSSRAGEDTIFLFLRHEFSSRTRPRMELRGVQRIVLEAGAHGEVAFTLTPDDFAFPQRGPAGIEAGSFQIMIGHSADPAQQQSTRLTLVAADQK